jgi:predicted patatin/cPLA2 family phospholipase
MNISGRLIMSISKTGLVLEGGGLRGVYTSGVLRYFMEKNLYFPYVIGVSMGACNAANYMSKQPERNRTVNISFVNDRRYLSYLRLFTGGELFGMDFIFDTIPNKLVPYDYDTFYKNKSKCVTVVTDCVKGIPLYYEKAELGEDYLKVLRASSSLPFVSKPVTYKGRVLMDGGMTDSIPVRRSIEDGYKKNVIILTQPKEYRKSPEKMASMVGLFYPRYKGLKKALLNRHNDYNQTIEYIDELEAKNKVFVIRPDTKLEAGRVERDKKVLYAIYDRGYDDAKARYGALSKFLG